MLSQQNFEMNVPVSFSLKGAHQHCSAIIVNTRASFFWTRHKNKELFQMQETSEKLRNTKSELKTEQNSLPASCIFTRWVFPSGLFSDQRPNDFLNVDKLHAIPWLPKMHCAFCASEFLLLLVLSSILALTLAAGSLFPYLVFCDDALAEGVVSPYSKGLAQKTMIRS